MSEIRIYTNGAILPRYVVGERADPRPTWRVGNILLTEQSLELTAKGEQILIPLPHVAHLGSLPTVLPPAPAAFEQTASVVHLDGQQYAATGIAFPKVTVRNFPLQLAAMLTGSIRIFIPKGATAASGYEEAWLRFVLDEFRIQRVVGEARVPLESISSLTFGRAKGQDQREYVECTLHYVEGSSVRSASFVTFDRIPFLAQLLGAVQGLRRNLSLVQAVGSAGSLSEQAQQVAVLLYTGGVTASAIEGMLTIKPDDLDKIYEDLLKMGLAEVVKVRKEIQLTPAGMKVVDDIMKKQLMANG